MASVYLETTIPSYLTAWRSPDLLMAARQQATREWWDTRRTTFDLVVSDLVIAEASRGDQTAAVRRLEVLQGIPLIESDDETDNIVAALLHDAQLPERAAADALHIALATSNSIDFILTWNFTHIANAVYRPKIEKAIRAMGFVAPTICTPEELLRVDS